MGLSVNDDRKLANVLEKFVLSAEPVSKRQAVAKPTDWTVPGLLGKSRVRTSVGEVAVGSLKEGDSILSTSGRMVRIRRVDRINLDHSFLQYHPEAHPVCILASAFGRGLPERDLIVSPGQVLAFKKGLFPLRPMKAGEITGNSSVARAVHGALTYCVIELDQPTYVYAEGVPVLIQANDTVGRDDDNAED
jgi:hypothetical protein